MLVSVLKPSIQWKITLYPSQNSLGVQGTELLFWMLGSVLKLSIHWKITLYPGQGSTAGLQRCHPAEILLLQQKSPSILPKLHWLSILREKDHLSWKDNTWEKITILSTQNVVWSAWFLLDVTQSKITLEAIINLDQTAGRESLEF